ncbi:hypothetical protein FNV43_RR03878 [Rhamnella rubrinervis]|uniref:Uncharacterized protein n=1 Tax=Rhamnella rubrinervis TaxID=2594499 RepID=A0A8K0HJZ0_9ROSA|nr:hypothetical protein FNV43_RR03878 [Rhamnella rubrinervis]
MPALPNNLPNQFDAYQISGEHNLWRVFRISIFYTFSGSRNRTTFRGQLAASHGALREVLFAAQEEEKKAHESIQSLPDLRDELDSLRKEYHRLRATLQCEKGLNIEQGEELQAMEKNLIAMAREVEKLPVEVLNAENKAHAGGYLNPDSSYLLPMQGRITYAGSYLRPHVQMGVGLLTGEGTIAYRSDTSAAAPTTSEAAVWGASDPALAPCLTTSLVVDAEANPGKCIGQITALGEKKWHWESPEKSILKINVGYVTTKKHRYINMQLVQQLCVMRKKNYGDLEIEIDNQLIVDWLGREKDLRKDHYRKVDIKHCKKVLKERQGWKVNKVNRDANDLADAIQMIWPTHLPNHLHRDSPCSLSNLAFLSALSYSV